MDASISMSQEAAFDAFVLLRTKSLRSISARTQGESDFNDVKQTAWLLAMEIEQRKGTSIDFASFAYQDFILGCLFNQLVKFADKTIRFAIRADSDPDSATYCSIDDLVVSSGFMQIDANPFSIMEAAEDERLEIWKTAHMSSYSEVVAYWLLLLRFEWDAVTLARHLQIVKTTLRSRMLRAAEILTIQPTLFDGKAMIDPDFEPVKHKPPVRVDGTQQYGQAILEFDLDVSDPPTKSRSSLKRG